MLQNLGEEVMNGSDDLVASRDVSDTFKGERLLAAVYVGVFFDAFLEDLLLLFVMLL